MYLVDTNIFLELLLSQAKKEECETFLQTIRNGKKTAIVTDFTIHSIIVTMDSLHKLKELTTFLLSLTAYKGLHIHHTTLTEEVNATSIATEQKLDMDDAIQYSVALSTCTEAIISFDKHFNNLRIPRKEPQQVA